MSKNVSGEEIIDAEDVSKPVKTLAFEPNQLYAQVQQKAK